MLAATRAIFTPRPRAGRSPPLLRRRFTPAPRPRASRHAAARRSSSRFCRYPISLISVSSRHCPGVLGSDNARELPEPPRHASPRGRLGARKGQRDLAVRSALHHAQAHRFPLVLRQLHQRLPERLPEGLEVDQLLDALVVLRLQPPPRHPRPFPGPPVPRPPP